MIQILNNTKPNGNQSMRLICPVCNYHWDYTYKATTMLAFLAETEAIRCPHCKGDRAIIDMEGR